MTSAAAGAAIAFGIAKGAESISGAYTAYGNAENQYRVAKYNAQLTEERQKSLSYESAANMTLRRLNAYSEIGTGKSTMAARGNIGTSADSATMNAYLNLANDLSAMNFNYENKYAELENERRGYLYQAKIAHKQRKNAIVGGFLGVGGSLTSSYVNYASLTGSK